MKITQYISFFVILSIYLQFYYKDFIKEERISSSSLPQREIILDIKINRKFQNLLKYESQTTTFLGTVEKTQKLGEKLMNHTILCSINNKTELNLRGRIVRVKGIISFEDMNYMKIKRCSLISVKNTNIYSQIVGDLRLYIIKTFEKVDRSEKKISGFLNAIFLGDKKMLSQREKENYQYSGTMHLFAVSGLHVGFLYLIFKFIFSSFCKKRKVSELLVLLMILIYLELIYYPPSAMRATMMLFVWQCTTIFSKRKNTFSSLFLSCLILLILDPSYFLSIGFQLSYTVVLSILVYSKISKQIPFDRFNFFKKFLFGSLITSFSAFCGSMLLVYDYFNLIVPISIIINLFAVPIAFLFVFTSFIMLIFQPFLGVEIFSDFFYFINWLLEVVINFFNFEDITYFKLQTDKNISNIVHFYYPFSFIIFFLSEKRFIMKSFAFILIPSLIIFITFII